MDHGIPQAAALEELEELNELEEEAAAEQVEEQQQEEEEGNAMDSPQSALHCRPASAASPAHSASQPSEGPTVRLGGAASGNPPREYEPNSPSKTARHHRSVGAGTGRTGRWAAAR